MLAPRAVFPAANDPTINWAEAQAQPTLVSMKTVKYGLLQPAGHLNRHLIRSFKAEETEKYGDIFRNSLIALKHNQSHCEVTN